MVVLDLISHSMFFLCLCVFFIQDVYPNQYFIVSVIQPRIYLEAEFKALFWLFSLLSDPYT